MNMPYFIWNDIDSRDMGIVVNKLPPIIKAERNIEKIEVMGRNGFLTKDYKTYKSVTKSVECTLTNGNIDKICSWLDGSSDIIFSNERDKLYKATIINQIPLQNIIDKFYNFLIQFECQPLKYSTYDTEKLNLINLVTIRNQPAINPLMSLNYNGGGVVQANKLVEIDKKDKIVINNNGTLECKPIIIICGTGDITLHITHNNSTKDIILKNIEENITINTDIEECYKEINGVYTGQNNKLYSDFPVFQQGESKITWEGNVQLIKIKKNECYL